MQTPAGKIIESFRARGIAGVLEEFRSYRHRVRERRNYQKWLRAHGSLNESARANVREQIERLEHLPLISIVLPVYNVDEKWLRLCIGSVLKQIYGNWELCVADDCTPSPHIRPILEEFAANDDRIKVIFRRENGHISAASNTALELTTGEFTVLLDHDDELSEDALFWVANEIIKYPSAEMVYSDEDVIDERGRRYDPKFKPDFARDLFYSLNLVTHLSAYRTELLKRIGGFRVGMEGSQDYDLALRVIEQIPEENIRHIPRILYHWRAIRTSVAYSGEAKPYAYEKAREALQEHFVRTGVEAAVEKATHNLNRVRYKLPQSLPNVSLIMTGSEEQFVVASRQIAETTDYSEIEIIPAFHGKSSSERLNLGAEKSAGEIMCFLDVSLRPLSPNWLKELVSFAAQEKVGIIGPKILNNNMNVIDAGSILGTSTVVGSAHKGFARRDVGYFFRAVLIGNYSAVSSQCFALRRDVFESVKGFDAEHLHDYFVAADLCLRIRERGLRVVFTPYAELVVVDEAKPNDGGGLQMVDEYEYFCSRWQSILERDPFYNPNLSKKRLFTIGV